MTKVFSGRLEMLSNMTPSLDENEYLFCFSSGEVGAISKLSPLATFHESEGLTLILEKQRGLDAGFDASLPMRRIILNVNSALDGVGLTAGVAQALADAEIPCNMVAAFHHDHVFVPAELAERALNVLQSVQQRAASQDI